MQTIQRITSANEFALCEIGGHFVYPADLRLTPTRAVLPGNVVLEGSTVVGGHVAVRI